MFGFDERYAMFDITPVENQFVLEYLPDAKGDYVKVYLYGLMRCYHPEEDMSLERMSRELNMTEDDITAAFRYWERRKLVRRVSDNPPKWQYINIKQKSLTDGSEPADPEFEEFSRSIYDVFDGVRRLHGNELNTCFEWREDLKLPTEVIIMLLNHMVQTKGKNFKFSDAQKVAIRMANDNTRTVEEAEAFFSRDESLYGGARKILKLLGKSYQPSEAQVEMYRKWTREWHFSHEAVEEAVKLTAKGDPSMGYLDGILRSMRQENAAEEELKPEQVIRSSHRADALKEILKVLGRGEVTPQNLELYDRMKTLYPQDVILTAARECSYSGKGIEDVLKLLESWKDKGLENSTQVNQYVKDFHNQTELIRELRNLWGMDPSRVRKTDRGLVSKWEKDLGFSREMILTAAAYAADATIPTTYLDKILTEYKEKGITTPEQAEKERNQYRMTSGKTAGKPARTVVAQQYEQRDYTGVQDELIAQQDKDMEEFMRNENGGKPDA